MTALVNSSGKFSDIYWIKKHTVCTHDTTTNKLGIGYCNKNSLTKKKIANQKRYQAFKMSRANSCTSGIVVGIKILMLVKNL